MRFSGLICYPWAESGGVGRNGIQSEYEIYISALAVGKYMEDSRIKRINLYRRETEKDLSMLEAVIDDSGDLLLEGYDLGETPQDFWGDEDYEYWWIVKKKYKKRILRLLVKEQFDTNSDLRNWRCYPWELRINRLHCHTCHDSSSESQYSWCFRL